MSTSDINPVAFNLHRALYSKQEAAELCSVCLRTIDNLVKAGKLKPPVKVGRENRFYATDLAQYLAGLRAAA